MDIVIRSPNWIGDCVMSLPAVRTLKANLPHANIYMAAKQYLCPIYQNIGEIVQTIPIPDNLDFKTHFEVAAKLKEYRFDYGILFTNSFHSALLFKLAGIKNRIGYVKDCRGWLLAQKIRFPQDKKHDIDFYMDIVSYFFEFLSSRRVYPLYSLPGTMPAESAAPAGFPVPAPAAGSTLSPVSTGSWPGLELIRSDGEVEHISALLGGFGINLSAPIIGISPSAAYGTAKEWLPERFRELIRRIREEAALKDAEILLFGSAGEREKIARIINGLNSGKVHNLAGKLKLREAIAAVSLCRLFISNDSGLMHVAAAFGLPLAALFGPTPPYKSRPRHSQARVLHHPVPCAPCRHRVCPLKEGNHACMTAITAAEVLETVISLWQSTSPASLSPSASPSLSLPSSHPPSSPIAGKE